MAGAAFFSLTIPCHVSRPRNRRSPLVRWHPSGNLPAMLTPTSVKDALQSTAPRSEVLVQGWVRTRRDAKDFSFIELNDGSCLRNLQIIARNTLPNYAAVQRLITGRCNPRARRRSSPPRAKAKTGKWSPIPSRSSAHRTTATPCRRKGTRRSSCARSPTFVRARIYLAASFASAAGSLLPCTSFSRSAVLFTSTRRSSPEATARARANCSGSRRSI